MRTNNIFWSFFFFTVMGNAQEATEKMVYGQVIADSSSVGGVNVINLVNEKATVTDSNGEFRILAKADDLLVLSAVNLEYKRRLLEKDDFDKKVIIRMIPKAIVLDEVVINEHPEINAVNLGILAKAPKKYTVNERRLATAGDFKPIHLLGIIAGGMPLDPVFNAINGKTAMLKKAVATEKKEQLLKKISQMFESRYFTEQLKIPADYVSGFHYFLLEDATFVAAIQSKNKTMATFLIGGLAQKYIELITVEGN